jgi:hypothetical protein
MMSTRYTSATRLPTGLALGTCAVCADPATMLLGLPDIAAGKSTYRAMCDRHWLVFCALPPQDLLASTPCEPAVATFGVGETALTDALFHNTPLDATGSGTKAQARAQARRMLAAVPLQCLLCETEPAMPGSDTCAPCAEAVKLYGRDGVFGGPPPGR